MNLGTDDRVQTADWSVHYTTAGHGDPVVLIHGSAPGTSGAGNFAHNIAPLADRFRVIAPDLPGWGASDPAPPEHANSANAIVQFLDALGIERASLVGTSMGASIALRVAVDHPDRVDRIVTCGAPGPTGPSPLVPAGLTEGQTMLLRTYREPSEKIMREFCSLLTFDPNAFSDDTVRARAAETHRRPEHLRNFLDGISRPHFLPFLPPEHLQRVLAPTLLIHGRDDRVVPCDSSLRLLPLIDDSRLLLMNRCGHCPQFEHANEFNRVVADFIAMST